MRRTDRLFELIQLFRGGRLWRGQELAERLSVSVRTIYRDIDTLAASGVPIEGERGIGFVLRTPIFLPPLTLTPQELEALQLGVTMVRRVVDEELRQAADDLLQKIDAVLPSDRQGKDYAKGVGVFSPRISGGLEALPVLRDAVRAKRRLELAYARLDESEAERRTVRPLHLEYWGQVWTLTAWCELRDDFRVFRVDRVTDVVPGVVFLSERGKTIEDYFALMRAKEGAP